jgi:prolipoprotein diacylglyceryltransferase
MFPVLFQVGSFTFYTFNLFIILGLIVACYFVWKKAREEVEEEEKIIDVFLAVLVFGLLGGRITEGILSFEAFGLDIYKLFLFWVYPGFSIWGALGAAAIFLFWLCKKRNLDFPKISDYLSLGIASFLPFLFLGHIFAGSYFGSETGFFWGVSVPGLLGRRHPTAILGFFASLLILFVIFKFGAKKHFPGFLALVFLSLFSSSSFLVEWLRGDSLYLERKIENLICQVSVFGLSTSLLYFKSKRSIGEDFSLVFAILGNLTKGFILGAAKIKKFITRRRKKLWQIPQTHYKM